MKRVIVAIDTSDSNATRVAVIINGTKHEKTFESKQLKSQTVLPLLEQLLKEHSISVSEISEISVHSGPGSFTGLRVGAAIANTLGFLFHIPVNGQLDRNVLPSY